MFGGKKKGKSTPKAKKGKNKVLATLNDRDRVRLSNQFRLCSDARITSAMMQNSYDALWMEFKRTYELPDNVGSVDMDTGEVYEAEGPVGHSGVVKDAPPMGKDG